MLKNEYLVAEIGVDTTENGPRKGSNPLPFEKPRWRYCLRRKPSAADPQLLKKSSMLVNCALLLIASAGVREPHLSVPWRAVLLPAVNGVYVVQWSLHKIAQLHCLLPHHVPRYGNDKAFASTRQLRSACRNFPFSKEKEARWEASQMTLDGNVVHQGKIADRDTLIRPLAARLEAHLAALPQELPSGTGARI